MNKGILFILISGVFFSIINALVKYLHHIPALEIVLFRSIISLLLSYTAIYRRNESIFSRHTPLLLGRGITGSIALCLYFYTIQKIPLATAVTILYLAPIFTILLAIFIVKEYPSWKQIPFFLLSFVGATLLKSFDPRVDLLYFSMALIAAFFAGLAYNFIRLLKGKVGHHVVIIYFPLVTIPLVLPFVVPIWVTPNIEELVGLIGIGLLTQLAQIFMTKAYMLEKASKISQFSYLTSVYAYLTGIIFFDEHMGTMSLIGLLLILIGLFFSSYFSEKEEV